MERLTGIKEVDASPHQFAGNGSVVEANAAVPNKNLVSYDEMMARVQAQMELVASQSELFDDFADRLHHGETNQQLDCFTQELASDFQAKFPAQIQRIVDERSTDRSLAITVKDLSSEQIQKLGVKAFMHYLVERDLLGPLIAHFALSIQDWQQEGKLPGVSIAMLRDFQPFYTALNELGVVVHPWYLRRDMFGIDDELTAVNEATLGVAHNGKLSLWLEPLLLEEHVTLLDSGCWGTIVYDIASLRSVIDWLHNSGTASNLLGIRPALRAHILQNELPYELQLLLSTGLNDQQISMRWGVVHAAIQDDKFLQSLVDSNAERFTTSALDHYSHAYQDPRYPGYNHQMIYSHVDAVAGHAMPDAAFGEVINDTIEENLASKGKAGPTKLLVNGNAVFAAVERNTSFEAEVVALAANIGASDAVKIAKKKQNLGMDLNPAATVAHIAQLHEFGKLHGAYTGVLPDRTPTWSEGGYFLSEVWQMLAKNPHSTFIPFDAEKGIQI